MIQSIITPIVLSVSSVSVGGMLIFKELRDKMKTSYSSSSLGSENTNKNNAGGLRAPPNISKASPTLPQQQQQQKQAQKTPSQQPRGGKQLNDASLLYKPNTLPRAEYVIAAYDSDGPKRMDPLIRENENNNNNNKNNNNNDSVESRNNNNNNAPPSRPSPMMMNRI